MTMPLMHSRGALAALLLWGVAAAAQAQTSAFTYQGRLQSAGAAANGTYDFRFTLHDAVENGVQVGAALTNATTAVTNGLFTAPLDFGAQPFAGANRWLEIAVRTNNGGAFIPLGPRQPIAAAPYAITAGNVMPGGLAPGGYASLLNLSNAGNQFSGNYAGNGAGVTNLNASNLAAGSLADARLSTNIPRLSLANTFTAPQTISSAAQTPLQVTGSNAGGTWLNLGNTSAGGHTWNLITSAAGNSEGAGKFLLRDSARGVAMTWSTNGHVGIGNSNPERPLALTGTGASAEWLSLRNTNNATAWHLNSYLGGLNFAQSGVADARLFLSTNSGNVGIGTSLPGAKLDVNGAVRAGGGIVFPDGSVQTRAAAGSTSPTTISGYSPGTTVAVTLNDIGCELTGPLTISADSSALGLGSLDNATARVRRVRPAGASDWATAFGNVVIRGIPLSNPTNSFRLAVTVAQAGVATQSLTITNLFFTRYKLTGGNGQLWEEGDLIARANAAFPVVRLGAVPASSPSADVPGLSVVVNGSALPGTVMASLPLLATYPINVISVTNKFVGSMTMVPDVRLTLRANVSSGGALLDWLTDRSVSGYRTLAIRRSGSTLVAANSAYGSEYRLRIADDGLPIEELDVTCAQFTAP